MKLASLSISPRRSTTRRSDDERSLHNRSSYRPSTANDPRRDSRSSLDSGRRPVLSPPAHSDRRGDKSFSERSSGYGSPGHIARHVEGLRQGERDASCIEDMPLCCCLRLLKLLIDADFDHSYARDLPSRDPPMDAGRYDRRDPPRHASGGYDDPYAKRSRGGSPPPYSASYRDGRYEPPLPIPHMMDPRGGGGYRGPASHRLPSPPRHGDRYPDGRGGFAPGMYPPGELHGASLHYGSSLPLPPRDSYDGQRGGPRYDDVSRMLPSRGGSASYDVDMRLQQQPRLPEPYPAAAPSSSGYAMEVVPGLPPGLVVLRPQPPAVGEEDKVWIYQDPQGRPQGPHSLRDLRKWVDALKAPIYAREYEQFVQSPVWRVGAPEVRSTLMQLLGIK